MYKMKQGGEEVADEIALHEANLAAAQAAAAAEAARTNNVEAVAAERAMEPTKKKWLGLF